MGAAAPPHLGSGAATVGSHGAARACHSRAGLQQPVQHRRQRFCWRSRWFGQDRLRRVRPAAAVEPEPGRPLRRRGAVQGRCAPRLVRPRRTSGSADSPIRRPPPDRRACVDVGGGGRASGRLESQVCTARQGHGCAHRRDDGGPQDPGAQLGGDLYPGALGHALPPLEAAQERAVCGLVHRGRDAPDRRDGGTDQRAGSREGSLGVRSPPSPLTLGVHCTGSGRWACAHR